MKKKEDLRILKTKASLYRALLGIMKKKLYENIKVSDICAKAAINRSTFYDHFKDKNELLHSLIEDMEKDIKESLEAEKKSGTTKEINMEILKTLLDYIDKNKDLYSSILKINENSIARDMMIKIYTESMTEEIDKNLVNDTGIPTSKIALFYSTGIISIIESALIERNFNKEEILKELDVLIPEFKMKKKS